MGKNSQVYKVIGQPHPVFHIMYSETDEGSLFPGGERKRKRRRREEQVRGSGWEERVGDDG